MSETVFFVAADWLLSICSPIWWGEVKRRGTLAATFVVGLEKRKWRLESDFYFLPEIIVGSVAISQAREFQGFHRRHSFMYLLHLWAPEEGTWTCEGMKYMYQTPYLNGFHIQNEIHIKLTCKWGRPCPLCSVHKGSTVIICAKFTFIVLFHCFCSTTPRQFLFWCFWYSFAYANSLHFNSIPYYECEVRTWWYTDDYFDYTFISLQILLYCSLGAAKYWFYVAELTSYTSSWFIINIMSDIWVGWDEEEEEEEEKDLECVLPRAFFQFIILLIFYSYSCIKQVVLMLFFVSNRIFSDMFNNTTTPHAIHSRIARQLSSFCSVL